MPIELLEIERKMPLPVEMDKAKLEILIFRTTLCHTWNQSVTEVLVSSFDREVDLRTVLHALRATKNGSERLVVLSSDTDVLILFLYYWNELKSEGLEELWIKSGVKIFSSP